MQTIEEVIIEKLRKDGPCSLDDVVLHLSPFNTADIFIAIDRMMGDGRVLLRQLGYSKFELTLKHAA